MASFLSKEQLKKLNFKKLGNNVLISEKVSLYGCEYMEIDDNSRIDDFCILSASSAGISIGKYVHIACFCSLMGKGKITLSDFSGISSRVAIYSSSDDYSGHFLTNPTVSFQYTNVITGPVLLEKHVIIGASTIILPNVTLQEGVSVGALSLVNRNCESFKLYSGVPAKYIKDRSRDLLNVEQKMIEDSMAVSDNPNKKTYNK